MDSGFLGLWNEVVPGESLRTRKVYIPMQFEGDFVFGSLFEKEWGLRECYLWCQLQLIRTLSHMIKPVECLLKIYLMDLLDFIQIYKYTPRCQQ